MKPPSFKLTKLAKLQALPKLLQEKLEQKLDDLPPWLLLEPKEHEPERPQPTLALYRGPFGSGPCARSKEVPDGLRPAVTESCPRCGAGSGIGGAEGMNGEAACILESVELDLRLLDEERSTEALREVVGRLEPKLI